NQEEIFRQIFLLYYRKVFRFFVRRGLSIEESKDLTQDTFLRVKLAEFRGDVRFETWLFRIASNLYRHRLRSGSALRSDVAESGWDADDLSWNEAGRKDILPPASALEIRMAVGVTREDSKIVRKVLGELGYDKPRHRSGIAPVKR